MKKSFTRRQTQILEYIRSYVEKEGVMPQLKTIADHFGVTSPTMCVHLKALRVKGALAPVPTSRFFPRSELFACQKETCPRKLKVIRTGESSEDMFVLAPGGRAETDDPAEMIAYEMPDDSLFDIGIHCGDIVIGSSAEYLPPRQGDLVIAELPEGTFVRILLSFRGKKVSLGAAVSDRWDNPLVKKEFKKLHTVISLIRYF